MRKLYRGAINYKGKIEKDTLYAVKAEGPDWYKLQDNTYIPKFVLSQYNNEIEEEYEEDVTYESLGKKESFGKKRNDQRKDSYEKVSRYSR